MLGEGTVDIIEIFNSRKEGKAVNKKELCKKKKAY